ncbi:MAG: flagellar basal body-associated FliL family protein [Lachnospiraceae bacterium]|nr:flagellar basal body-associated FliL family protein [Lachnospiraceae bacterium]
MKKNLISILILALMVVNLVLTAIMMFSVMGTAKKTGALVSNIASVLNIELTPTGTEEEETTVALVDAESVEIPEMTIALKKTDDKSHYCLVSAAIYMNTKHEDYATYGTVVSTKVSIIQDIMNTVIGSYTLEEAQANTEAMKAEILKKIQETYGSTFIYMITFSNIMYQ